MRAVICDRYGPPEVLAVREVANPLPKDDEILVRNMASTVSSADCRVRAMKIPVGFGVLARLAFGVHKPRQPILGGDLAGEVVAVGCGVSRFKAGDRVFAMSGARMGCHAEYVCVPENGNVTLMPARLTFEEAAALLFGGTAALDFFRRGKLVRGEKVLVNGASGAVGSAAVQLARHFGAEVTGVCSTANASLVKSLGAHRVIDYVKEDFTKCGETYDVIVDPVGTAPFRRSRAALREGGRLLQVLAGLPDILQGLWGSIGDSRRIIAGPATERREDLLLLAHLAEVGQFKPVIDRVYPMERIVEAHGYVDGGHKRGNVIVTLTA